MKTLAIDFRQSANYNSIEMRVVLLVYRTKKLLVFCILLGIAYFVIVGLGIGSALQDGILGGWLVALTIWLARVDALVRITSKRRFDQLDTRLDKIDASLNTILKK